MSSYRAYDSGKSEVKNNSFEILAFGFSYIGLPTAAVMANRGEVARHRLRYTGWRGESHQRRLNPHLRAKTGSGLRK